MRIASSRALEKSALYTQNASVHWELLLTCENRAWVACANSCTYKWRSCVLRSRVENLAHSNFAFFTGFIMSSLIVLPYSLLGSCHSWFSFNGVNEEVTVKLMFVTAAARRPFTWQQKVHIWRKRKKTSTQKGLPFAHAVASSFHTQQILWQYYVQ